MKHIIQRMEIVALTNVKQFLLQILAQIKNKCSLFDEIDEFNYQIWSTPFGLTYRD